SSGIGSVGNHIFVEFRNEGNPGVLDSPQLLRMVSKVWLECRRSVNLPIVNPVFRTRRAEVGMPAPILDAAQQECRAVRKKRRSGVEDRIDRVGPVSGAQDGVPRVTME